MASRVSLFLATLVLFQECIFHTFSEDLVRNTKNSKRPGFNLKNLGNYETIFLWITISFKIGNILVLINHFYTGEWTEVILEACNFAKNDNETVDMVSFWY